MFKFYWCPTLYFQIIWCSCSLTVRRVWRYQRGNRNPYIEAEQTTQWAKQKGQKNKPRSTKHTDKTKDRVTQTSLKPAVNSGAPIGATSKNRKCLSFRNTCVHPHFKWGSYCSIFSFLWKNQCFVHLNQSVNQQINQSINQWCFFSFGYFIVCPLLISSYQCRSWILSLVLNLAMLYRRILWYVFLFLFPNINLFLMLLFWNHLT